MREKGYTVNYAVEIGKFTVESFDKGNGNTISEKSEAAANVHADEGDRLVLDVSLILNCDVWTDLAEISHPIRYPVCNYLKAF